jgi:hypothetical protein
MKTTQRSVALHEDAMQAHQRAIALHEKHIAHLEVRRHGQDDKPGQRDRKYASPSFTGSSVRRLCEVWV